MNICDTHPSDIVIDPFEEAKKQLFLRRGKEYEIDKHGDWAGMHTTVFVYHKKCEKQSQLTLGELLNTSWSCPHCNSRSTEKALEKVTKFMKRNNMAADTKAGRYIRVYDGKETRVYFALEVISFQGKPYHIIYLDGTAYTNFRLRPYWKSLVKVARKLDGVLVLEYADYNKIYKKLEKFFKSKEV